MVSKSKKIFSVKSKNMVSKVFLLQLASGPSFYQYLATLFDLVILIYLKRVP